MKRLFLLSAMALGLLTPSVSTAADGATLFVQKCGSCHKRGGQAPAVNPADKAGVVWEKYFERGRHPGNLSQSLNNGELGSVIQYLKAHAADSDQPATAVIPK